MIVFVLVIVVFCLKRYTDHGVEVEVPQITGLYLEEAQQLVLENQLQILVVDSTFSSKVPLGTIVEQNPVPMTHVKRHRTIYVVLNARQRRQVPLPELHDLSYRQAQNMLTSLGLIVDSIEYEPSEYKDLILDTRCGNQSVETGKMLTEGTHLILVVGFGQGTEMVPVPDLRGLNQRDARQLLLNNRLTLGAAEYDAEVTEENADRFVVYSQSPAADEMYLEGSSVSVKLSMDLEKTVTEDNEDNEENFF
ncbi:MAG: PASTA domain-containing protein [Paludibacteraceae bacterium]|nr:PASTA domain-containing protein [Paludibacteraceae bacterium]